MRYDMPYGSFGFYGDPRYYMAAQREKQQIRREANRLGLAAFLGICLFIGLSFIGMRYYRMRQPYQPLWESFGGVNPVLYYLIVALGNVLGMALPVLLYFAMRRVPLSKGLPFERIGGVKLLALVSLGGAGCMLANFPANIVVNLEHYFGFNGADLDMPLTDDLAVLVLYVVSIAIIPPIVEEMMFRGMILQGLRRFGDGFAVVASAALFGLYHANLVQIVFAFLSGLVLGFVVIRTNSLLPSILVHALNNGMAVMVQLIERYQGTDAAVMVSTVQVVALFALGFISLVYFLIKDRKFFHAGVSYSPLRFSQKMGALFSNLGVVLIMIYAVLGSVAALGNT